MYLEQKSSLKTHHTEEQCHWPLEQIDPETLKQKLQHILETLEEQMSSQSLKFQQEKRGLLETIHQKDDIIERLAKANSQLTIKNQQLQKNKLRDSVQYKAKMYNLETEYQKQKTHLISVIKYLETKNEELLQKIKKLELNSLKRTLKPYDPRSAKYLMVEDYSGQFEHSATLSSKNGLKQSKLGISPTHKYTGSKLSQLSKVASAKHLSSLFKNDYNSYKHIENDHYQDNEELSPIKKTELFLGEDRRQKKLSKSSVRCLDDEGNSPVIFKKMASLI